MAAGATAFGISLGVNAAIGTLCLLFFCFMRLRRLMRKFYMPRQFMDGTATAGKPKTLPKKFLGWIRPAWASSEEEIIRVAGYDAAMYTKIISFAFEIFTWIAVWMIIIILPVNLVGHEVSNLTGTNNVPTSQFTYWVPNATAPSPDGSTNSYSAPDFYAKTPPAPAGVSWWKYNAGVPPLPQPVDVLGQNYSGYQWRYDADYQAKSYTFSDLDKVTLTNVSPRSHSLWAHAVATWIVAIIVMRATWRYSKDAVQLHIMYLRNATQGREAHSVIVTDIPGLYAGTVSGFVPEKVRKGMTKGAEKSKIPEAISTGTNFVLPSSVPRRRTSSISPRTSLEDIGDGTQDGNIVVHKGGTVSDLDAWIAAQQKLSSGMTIEEMVTSEYNELYEGDVDAVHVVYQSKDLDPLVQEYEGILRSLEDLIDDYASKMQRDKDVKRQTTRVIGGRYGTWGKQNYGGWWPKKTDLLDWYVKRATELRRLILVEQDKCSRKPGPTAFITFKSRRSQTIAANSLQHPDVKSWHVASAPQPDDIIWDNVKLRSWEKATRFAVIWGLFIIMALFYTIPIGAVQAIIEVQRLEKIPFFRDLVKIAFIRSLIEAILPGLVLNIFLLILPFLLRFMNRQQGMISQTAVDFGLNRKFYIFLIITVFVGSIIGGTLFNQFDQWIDSPSSAVTILGTAAPLTSIFFLTYIALQAFTSLPLSFLRLFGLVIYWIRSKFAATPRAKARVWSEQRYSYGKELPRHMLILFVAVVFSVVNPLVPIMAIIYFTVALLTERYNMLYIYVPVADSGGKIWAEAYAQIITSLFFFELMMIALLAIKKSFSAILIVPLVAITFAFWQSCKPVFQKPLSVLALRTAVDMDTADREREGEISLDDSTDRYATTGGQRSTYMMPAMDLDEDKLDNVLREAQDVELALQGKKELDMQHIGEDVETGKSSGSSEAGSPTLGNGTTSQRLLVPGREVPEGDSASLQHTREADPGPSSRAF